MSRLSFAVAGSLCWARKWHKCRDRVWTATWSVIKYLQSRPFSSWRIFTTPSARTRGNKDSRVSPAIQTRFSRICSRPPKVAWVRSWRNYWRRWSKGTSSPETTRRWRHCRRCETSTIPLVHSARISDACCLCAIRPDTSRVFLAFGNSAKRASNLFLSNNYRVLRNIWVNVS